MFYAYHHFIIYNICLLTISFVWVLKLLSNDGKLCILCESKNLDLVIDFGKTPLANSYPKKLTEIENYFKLRILLCKSCGHVQLKDIVDPKLMFQNYLYVSGTSKVLVSHFENLAKKVIKKFRLKKNDKIVDIACNDGTLLKHY